MYAGGIIAIVASALLVMVAIICFCSAHIIELSDLLTQAEINELGYTQEELDLLLISMRNLVKVLGGFLLVISAMDLIFGIRVILDGKHLNNRKHNIITLLVVNVISGSLLVVGFMIAALCMKFKSAQQIVDEYQAQNNQM